MKILIYSLNFSPELTGVGKYSGEMARWLSNHGHDIRVVTAMPYYPSWKVFKNYSGKYYFREKVDNLDIWRSFHYVPNSISTFKRVLHLISFAVTSIPNLVAQIFWRPEIVFVLEPTFFCSPAALMLAKLSGGKAWLHIQDFELDAVFGLKKANTQWVKGFSLWIEKHTMNCFDKVSTISAKMLDLLKAKGVLEQKIAFLPNWADMAMLEWSLSLQDDHVEELLDGYRLEWQVSKEVYILMYSGNMGEKQGLELIIESARILIECKNIKFVMCGDGVARERLARLARGLPNIIWLPLQPRERFNDLLRSADIHLLPQLAGIADLVLPSKLIGMMASGRPVLACANEGTELEDVVKNCGIVVEPENVHEFCGGIQVLIGDEVLRARLGNAGREYVNKNLNQDIILSNFACEISKF